MLKSNNSTNIFESVSGVLNIAPVKLSGKYKIVVGTDNVLYLDDYNSRRVVIDKTQSFLSQVGNFLSTQTNITNNNKLKYGGFNHGKQKAFHVPLYINDKSTLPKYFVLNRVQSEEITDSVQLHKYSKVINLYDFDRIGLTNIFNEVLFYEYPIFFNWDDNNVNIFGYSFTNLCKENKTIKLLNSQANQPSLEVVNNMILNSFVNNNMIFPKFLNIEFEFDFDSTKFEFNNFFGFMSKKNKLDIVDFNPDVINISVKNYTDSFKYIQNRIKTDVVIEEPFTDILSTSTVSNIANQLPQVRFTIKNITPEDYFVIRHPDGTVFFEYIVTVNDIKATLNDTLNTVCQNAQYASGLNFLFSSKKDYKSGSFVITIKTNIDNEIAEEYFVETPNKIKPTDNNQRFFNGISDVDIEFFGTYNDQINYITINDKPYDILKTYMFNEKIIIRLTKDPNIQNVTVAQFFVTKYSELLTMIPIYYYSVNSTMSSKEQFNKDEYVSELTKRFIDDRYDLDDPRLAEFLAASEYAITRFDEFNDINDYIQYVNDTLIETADYIKLTITVPTNEFNGIYHNDVNILNMMFNSSGNTAYITPNILNLDKRFYDNNGNLDYILLDEDRLKFHWFLIKSECPEYLKHNEDSRQLRYFTDVPRLTSRLISNNISSNYCETIFLGVKYRLPQKYKNYQFAVYLNCNDETVNETKYTFDVNHQNKTVFLVINMYLDFVDLIRGGNIENQPFVDLSLLYSVQESHNTLSEVLYSFKSGGVLVCDDTTPVMFESNLFNDWKHYDAVTDKTYICLKRSTNVITSVFTEIFPPEGDFQFYVYSHVTIDGEVYNYASMIFTVKNIRILSNNYVWCEDLFVEFFDTKRLVINSNNTSESNFFKATTENIISVLPKPSNGLYSNYEATATILVDATDTQFTILNPVGETFSIKKYYFEMVKKVEYDPETNYKTITYNPFTFDEYVLGDSSWEGLLQKYDINNSTFEDSTHTQKITLFDRNQLWHLIRSILNVDVRFKHSTAAQTRKLINRLLVNNLAEYSSLKALQINNSDEFINMDVIQNDTGIAIWKHYADIGAIKPEMKAVKINRYSGVYNPALFIVDNELQFQADILSNRKDVLFNIFDPNYAGLNIGATGIWNEVTGNVVSSLFCKTDDIKIVIPYTTETNYKELLIEKLLISDILINNNKNQEYIQTINSNIDEYIKESYVNWLLEKFYILSNIKNELGQLINYEDSKETKYSIDLKPITTYTTRFEKLIFTFSRR